MFDFVRKHTRILQFVLFLLIFPSFVLFGVEGYTRMSDRGPVVASVGRDDIRPTHAKAMDTQDPLHAARSAELTSLWRLTAEAR